MKIRIIFSIALVLILSVGSLALADKASLDAQVAKISLIDYPPQMHISHNPYLLASVMEQGGRLDELNLTFEEGMILAEAMLRKMGIEPAYPDFFVQGSSKATPSTPFRTPAEFEPMQGVIIRYPWTFMDAAARPTFNGMLAALDGDSNITVHMIVTNASKESQVKGFLAAAGIAGTNFVYYHFDTNSIWSRDYGPIFIEEISGDTPFQSIVDIKYYIGRGKDDKIPDQMAGALSIDSYDMNLFHEGGNYMSDGAGTCFTSTGVFLNNPALSEAQIDQLALDYWGCEQYVKVEPLLNEGTTHIDMFAKIVDSNTVLVNEVAPAHTDYAQLESVATEIESTNNLEGTPFEVVRLPMNTYSSWGMRVFQTYTNSLIIGNKVLVPTYGVADDAVALGIYESLYSDKDMEVVGVDSAAIIEWGGAVHCVTMEQPAVVLGDDDDDDVTDDDDDTDDDDTTDDDDSSDDDDDNDAADDDDSIAADDDDDDDEGGCCG